MVEAKVHFFGPVRGIVRKKEQVVVLDDGATLRGLLEELGRSNGPKVVADRTAHLLLQ